MTSSFETRTIPAPADDTTTVDAIESLFAAVQPSSVFSEPVTAGNYTVITAREVGLAGGFGFGSGYGPGPKTEGEATSQAMSGGRGGGGGAGSSGRPIAAIIIGPDGVKVQPIVDVTKFMLAMFAMVGRFVGVFAKRSRRG